MGEKQFCFFQTAETLRVLNVLQRKKTFRTLASTGKFPHETQNINKYHALLQTITQVIRGVHGAAGRLCLPRGTRRCCGVETLIQRRNNAVCQVGRLNKEEKSMKRPVCQPVIDVRWPSLACVSVCVSVRRAYLAICSGCEEEITTCGNLSS